MMVNPCLKLVGVLDEGNNADPGTHVPPQKKEYDRQDDEKYILHIKETNIIYIKNVSGRLLRDESLSRMGLK